MSKRRLLASKPTGSYGLLVAIVNLRGKERHWVKEADKVCLRSMSKGDILWSWMWLLGHGIYQKPGKFLRLVFPQKCQTWTEYAYRYKITQSP